MKREQYLIRAISIATGDMKPLLIRCHRKLGHGREAVAEVELIVRVTLDALALSGPLNSRRKKLITELASFMKTKR